MERYELTEIRREVSFRLEGCDPIQLEFGRARFRPEKVTILTVAGVFVWAEVEGHRVLKDGTHGQAIHSRRWWAPSRTQMEEMPDWMESVILAAEAIR